MAGLSVSLFRAWVFAVKGAGKHPVPFTAVL